MRLRYVRVRISCKFRSLESSTGGYVRPGRGEGGRGDQDKLNGSKGEGVRKGEGRGHKAGTGKDSARGVSAKSSSIKCNILSEGRGTFRGGWGKGGFKGWPDGGAKAVAIRTMRLGVCWVFSGLDVRFCVCVCGTGL